MRKAYALLGVGFLVLFIGTGILIQRFSLPDEIFVSMTLNISSPAFEHNGLIPGQYTCESADVNPPLRMGAVPPGTQSLALVMEDPDAPVGIWDHWILYNIPPNVTEIEENSIPAGAIVGKNSWGEQDYGGPCPPDREHRYFFKLYALDTKLTLPEEAGKLELILAMEGHILAQGEFVGRYDRPR